MPWGQLVRLKAGKPNAPFRPIASWAPSDWQAALWGGVPVGLEQVGRGEPTVRVDLVGDHRKNDRNALAKSASWQVWLTPTAHSLRGILKAAR